MFVVLACLQPLLLPGRTGANAPAGPAPNNSSLAMPSEGSEKAMGAGALGSRRAEEGVAPTLGPPLASDVAATVPIAAPPSPGRIEEVTAGTSAGTTPDIAGALAELGGAAQKQERERQQAGIVAGGAPELVHGGASSNRAGDVELGTDSVGSREGPTDTAAAPASNMGSRRGGPSLHQQEVQTVEMSSSAKPTEIAASPRPSLLQPGPNSPVTRQAAEAQPNLSGAPGEGGGRLSEGKPWGGTSERELLVGAALHGGATSSGECPPPVRPPLKVFMYELPQKFNFGLFTKDPLGPDGQRVWSGTSVPSWPSRGGLRYQHSITYFLMADLVTPPHQRAAGSAAVRVLEPAEADVFFVPFFASLSFNTFGRSMKDPEALKDKALQEELVKFLKASPWWRRSGGRDHVLVVTHPNAFRFARNSLRSAMFILADFGRYSKEVARLSKDVIAPYAHMDGWVRKGIQKVVEGEEGVHFAGGRASARGIELATRGMRSSKFCLHPAGDTPSSCRLFDAIVSHCVPVVVSDKLELPFESELDYRNFTVFLSHQDSVKKGSLLDLLRGYSKSKWLVMWRRLREVQSHFEYQVPSVPGDATNMLWRQVQDKVPMIRLAINRSKRLVIPDWLKLYR